MPEEKKYDLRALYSSMMFPRGGNNWQDVKWTTVWGTTFVTMWDEEHMLQNVKYEMILNQMGIGPRLYCVFTNWMPHFEDRLLLLMRYIPHNKICLYPPRRILEGPFLQPELKKKGQVICARRTITKNPFFRTTFYTQQFVVYQKTGIYGSSIFG